MKRDDLFAGYEQGQADMLAKCIAAASDLTIIDDYFLKYIGEQMARELMGEIVGRLRALREKS